MPFKGNFTCNTFRTSMLTSGVNFATDTIKIALYTNAATLDDTTTAYTTTGEVVASGYTAGGLVLTPTVSSLGNVSFVSFANVLWNAAITARGALIYKDGGIAVCVLDFGADKTSQVTFPIQFPPATADSAIIRVYSGVVI
jgi:hypothetical protein